MRGIQSEVPHAQNSSQVGEVLEEGAEILDDEGGNTGELLLSVGADGQLLHPPADVGADGDGLGRHAPVLEELDVSVKVPNEQVVVAIRVHFENGSLPSLMQFDGLGIGLIVIFNFERKNMYNRKTKTLFNYYLMFLPSVIKIGQIRSLADKSFSLTNLLVQSDFLFLLNLTFG